MHIDAKNLIITKPENGVSLRKAVSLLNFLFFWGFAIYLMRWFIYITGWIVAYYVFGAAISDMGLSEIMNAVFTLYIPLILVASLILMGWATYNRRRYGGANDKRRVPPPPLSVEQVSEYVRFPVEKVEKMQESRCLICRFDERCQLADVDCFADFDEVEAVSGASR